MKRGVFVIALILQVTISSYAQVYIKGLKEVVLGGYNGHNTQTFDTASVSDINNEIALKYPTGYRGLGWIKYQQQGQPQEIPLLLQGDSLYVSIEQNRISFTKNSPTSFYNFYKQVSGLYNEQEQSLVKLKEFYADSSSFKKSVLSELGKLQVEKNKFYATMETYPDMARTYLRAETALESTNALLQVQSPPSQEQLRVAQKEMEKSIDLQTDILMHWGIIHRFFYSYYSLSNVLPGGHQHSTDFIVSRLSNSPFRNEYIEEIITVLQNISGRPDIAEYFSQKALATIEECDDFQENGDGISGRIKRQMQQLSIMRIGSPAPDQLLDNGKFISDINSKYKLIVFWGSWCDHCKQEIPQLKAYYSQLKKQDVEVVAMGMEDNADIHKLIASTNPWISHYVGRNWKAPTTESYYVYGTPTFFLVDEAMNIVAKPKSVEELKKWLEVHQ
ncbi:TlpA family protein disulfide reductase [Emticicia sp. 17c]|uniref:TlpA family protein disulfide reductase n=1 Tax=Emticicia sp. 17c TaxID=3127704 RepID=UPI00301BE14E